ncbi:MAG: ABC transporter substrate-binding protein [Phormidesmis sp.]
MAKRNELPALIASLFVTIGLLGGGAWFLMNNFSGQPGGTSDGPTPPPAAGKLDVAGADGSSGDSVLPRALSDKKQAGLDALASKDYETAQAEFEASLSENRNDPESRIYLNNAKIGESPSYEIALIVPAGDNVDAAQELMRGAAQAQAEINAGSGLNGTPLKILIVNDSDDKELAASVAADLVASKDVLGVVGHFSSGTTLAAAKIYETGGLTMISPTSTSVEISQAGDYIFRTVPSDRLAASTLASYALNTLNKKKAAVFYNGENAYSKSIKQEFVLELTGKQGEVVEFDITAPGFNVTQAMKTLQAEGAEVIMMALTLTPLDVPLQIISLNRRSLPLLGSDSLYSPKILSLGAENAIGLTVAVPWHILNHGQSAFVENSRQLWGADVNWRTVTAYDAVMTLAAGLRGEASRQGVAAVLAERGFTVEGATDPVRFFDTGDRNQPFQLVEVVPGNRSGSGYDFVPVE